MSKTPFLARSLTRRQLLQQTTLPLTAGALVILNGCTNTASACSDPGLQSAGEAQLRVTLGYVERAPESSKQCSGCQFFKANSERDCGRCEILNGAVSRQGVCNSWARLRQS